MAIGKLKCTLVIPNLVNMPMFTLNIEEWIYYFKTVFKLSIHNLRVLMVKGFIYSVLVL